MHRTEEIKITIEGLNKKSETYSLSKELAERLKTMIAESKGKGRDSILAEDLIPELRSSVKRPAKVLKGMRNREGITQANLARAIDVRQNHLSEMENGKRPIGKEMARRLSKALNCDYRLFL